MTLVEKRDAQGNLIQVDVENPGDVADVQTALPTEGFFRFDKSEIGIREGDTFRTLNLGSPSRNAGFLSSLGIDINTLQDRGTGGLFEAQGGLKRTGDISGEDFTTLFKSLQPSTTPEITGTTSPTGSIAAALDPGSAENIAAQKAATTKIQAGTQQPIPGTETAGAIVAHPSAPAGFGIDPTTGKFAPLPGADTVQTAAGEQQPATGTTSPVAPLDTSQLTKIANPEQLAEIAKSLGITPQNESDFLIRQGQDIFLKPEALQAFVDPTFRGGATGEARAADAGEIPTGPDLSNIADDGLGLGQAESPYSGVLDNYGVDNLSEGDNPVNSYSNTYSKIVEDLGLPNIKDAFNEVQEGFEELQLELNDKIADINDNPWLTEGARVQRIRKLEVRFEGRLGIATNQMKLFNSLYEQGLEEARFVAGLTQNQTQFDINTQIKLLQLAQDQSEALNDLDTQIVDANGRKLLVDKQTGETIADLGASTTTTKPPTGSQFTVANYASRIEQSNEIINDIGDQFAGDFARGGALPNFLQSDARQRYEQSKRNFINAVLRRESGAAIAPSEFESAEKQYFPVAGDGADVLADKKANRDLVQRNFISEAGDAFQSASSGTDDPLGIRGFL